ncbi:hypothetical protein LTR62_001174 [Meristemomyces frigidus]|uniref:Uncharacterized protein n=1 Tax=Meristemomyces frigidus TaxID=1508187 RepID=A0AAN7YQN6_9PEZI|nr:hypothetical protein LTR62_001174 [Meristemomyces frigidus]
MVANEYDDVRAKLDVLMVLDANIAEVLSTWLVLVSGGTVVYIVKVVVLREDELRVVGSGVLEVMAAGAELFIV